MAQHFVRATMAGLLLFVIGLAIGGGAFENFQRERERLEGWQRVDGEVVQLITESSRAARPVIGFTAAGGDRIRFTAMGSLGHREYHVGDRVPVLYPLTDPSGARIDQPILRWARSAYAAAGALVLMVLGAYVAWYARRRDAERQSAVE